MKKYFFTLLGGIFIAVGSLAVFNWWINPYNVFAAPGIEGVNELKVEAISRARMAKVYEVNRLQPDVIILGSSRALNVPIKPLLSEGESVYNLAMGGATGYEMYRMFQHANAVRPLRKVIIGIDEQFIDQATASFVEGRLRVDAKNQPGDSWRMMTYRDVFSSLFSLDALRSSVRTVDKQPDRPLDEYMMYDKRRRVSRGGGHHQMFRTVEGRAIPESNKKTVTDCEYRRATPVIVQAYKSPYFEKMMEIAYLQGIQFNIFFSPIHARLYETNCFIGQMPVIENTKRAIVETVETVAERLGKRPYPVWDFTGYNSITTEPVPELGDTTTLMRWYWEGSHFTSETGTLILEEMLGRNANADGDFGVRINTSNIEQHLRSIHALREQYHITNRTDVNEVRDMIR